MTDWNAYGDEGLPALAEAGVSWIAPGSMEKAFVLPLKEAIDSGEIAREDMIQNITNLIQTISKQMGRK